MPLIKKMHCYCFTKKKKDAMGFKVQPHFVVVIICKKKNME